MKHLLLIALALIFAASGAARASNPQDEIKKKQTQLEKLKKDIDAYEAKIKEREKKEHATLELLDTYDRQGDLLRKLIAKLHDQELLLQRDIEITRESIGGLNGRLSYLRQHYATYVSTVYRSGKLYDLELLLASKSLNQMLIRSEYLREFSEQRKKDLTAISARRNDLQRQNELLQDQLAEQRKLIADKASESAKLAAKMKKRKSMLTEIRRDKKNYQKEINRKTAAAKEIEGLIAKLMEADRKKRELAEKKAKENNTKLPERAPVTRGGTFGAKRGTLRWPVEQGKVVARFGTQQNPVLKTITKNTGIDIALPSGSPVASVADGEVSTIWWLPSFGNLLIVTHNDGYRTVYAHMSEIFVNEGDKVSEGRTIGKSGEALSGPLLHFEIWKDRDNQDPESWLRPRGLSAR
jgi:septal ring factor EnvC (AmiA/AmiB activator)